MHSHQQKYGGLIMHFITQMQQAYEASAFSVVVMEKAPANRTISANSRTSAFNLLNAVTSSHLLPTPDGYSCFRRARNCARPPSSKAPGHTPRIVPSGDMRTV